MSSDPETAVDDFMRLTFGAAADDPGVWARGFRDGVKAVLEKRPLVTVPRNVLAKCEEWLRSASSTPHAQEVARFVLSLPCGSFDCKLPDEPNEKLGAYPLHWGDFMGGDMREAHQVDFALRRLWKHVVKLES